MKDAATLLALAERVSALTEQDAATDVEIWLAAEAGPADVQSYEEGLQISADEARFRAEYMMGGWAPTRSIDAAMTLVPEGWGWTLTGDGSACVYSKEPTTANVTLPSGEVMQFPDVAASANAKAAMPALALTAACLRAHAAIAGEG